MGAHDSALIGEDPKGIPNNLMPILNKVASAERPYLEIFGDDYPTKDGTAERDYIHVMDLVEGHLAALYYLKDHSGLDFFNLGTGHAISVLDLAKQFEVAITKKINKNFSSRRVGDLPVYYANINKSAILLNWSVKRSVKEICVSSWLWYRSRGVKI